MNTTKLGPRPAPSMISFAADCFVVDGYTVTYSVGRSALHSGPARFGEDKAEAEAYARKCNRSVTEHKTPIMRRVKWF